MIRARYFALALLAGAWTAAAAPAFAQAPPSGAGYGAPGVSPYRTPAPMQGVDYWECPPEEIGGGYGPEKVFDGGFLRVEYLHWNIADPGDTLLGAPVLGNGDPRGAFPVFAPNTNNIIAMTRVPSTFPIALSDTNGVRVTGGLELMNGGTIEVGAFMLAKKESGFVINQFGQQLVTNPGEPFSLHFVPETVGTSVLDNGQVGNTVLQYNQSFEAVYQSQIWGAEANYVFDYDREGLFWLNPTLGLRYINLHERLNQTGVFVDTVLATPSITSTIDSVTYNNLYGPQFGTRLEMVTKWVNLGVDPKMMLLGNSMLGSVTTNHLRSNNDPQVKTDELSTLFTIGFDVNAYGTINFGDRFSVRVGYSFIWLNRVTRPENNIVYNDNGASNPPAFSTSLQRHDFIVHGLTFGGELKF